MPSEQVVKFKAATGKQDHEPPSPPEYDASLTCERRALRGRISMH